MESWSDHREGGQGLNTPTMAENGAKSLVLSELEKILDSKPFRSSSRSRQFLRFVVCHSLDGQTEKLKERTIGIEVYERNPDYATGDDPVVRVSAGEVRRRLEQYYHSAPPDLPVRIEIPLGSYSPNFYWSSDVRGLAGNLALEPTHPRVSDISERITANASRRTASHARSWTVIAVCLIAAAALVATSMSFHRQTQPKSALDDFWAPGLNSQHPILICLAKPVVYRPSEEIYQRYSKNHPGTFATEDQRDNQELPLDPNEKIAWKEMEVYPGYGVASGDVHAAVSLSDLFVEKGKLSQLRIGSDYSFEDLRGSPAVVIGAFNNRWTMEMTSNLHFALMWGPAIREQGSSGRTWVSQIGPDHKYRVDYGIVTRLLDSKTGQFVVAVAGLGAAGTQTAGEFVSNAKFLESSLKSAPPDWRTKNIQFVLQTNVIDSIPGPPRVVAAYFW